MSRVGITGADGFLGWHLRSRLHSLGRSATTANRATFADHDSLDAFVASSDVIVHAAGVNRNGGCHDDDVASANPALAEALVAAMERTGRWLPVLYANSIKSDVAGDPYGAAKQRAADILAEALAPANQPFGDLVLPHLFGEYGRPHYNSAVTTFGYQLAVGEEPDVNRDGQVELLHAQDVAQWVCAWVDDPTAGRTRLDGRPISIGELWDLMSAQHGRYVTDNTIPAFADLFEQRVFNVLRSQLDVAGFYPRPITCHADARGAFSELCRNDGLGQTSVSTSVPGITRGDHFHFDKIERFVVVGGQATIRLRRLLTDEVRQFEVCGDHPVLIDMPPLVTHNITNTGEATMTTIFWAGDHFDPANPDTYAEPVEVVS